jgi:hypothetical protein
MVALLAMIAAGAAIVYGVSAFWSPAARDRAARQQIRQALFDELQIVTLDNCTLKRYGSANDGGYLMCANLVDDVQAAYSYGIDKEDNWGCQVSRELGVPVHQYDCFTPHRPACDGGQVIFHDECVGATSATIDGQPFDTISSQISRNGDAGTDLLLKIDVEGAEWDALMATPDAVLDRIRQMPMEFHGVDERRFIEVVRRLKRTFYLVNLHFNNFGCQPDIAPFPAFAFQALWVNKRVARLDEDGASPAPLSPLNAPDQPGQPDCQVKP